MTGSSYVALVVPIMAFFAMAFWLGLVFYADSHPGYGRRKAAKRPTYAGTSDAVPASEHEQINDEILAGRAS